MTNAEEELQKSVVLSEEDAEFEEDDGGGAMAIDSGGAVAAPSQPPVIAANEEQVEAKHEGDDQNNHFETTVEADGPTEEKETVKLEQDAAEQGQPNKAGQEADSQTDVAMHDGDGDEDEDAGGEDDAAGEDNVGGDDAAGGDEDAEGEDDEVADTQGAGDNTASDDETDEEDEADEAEGVGAVKIKPGETEDEDSDSGDDVSTVSLVSDRESAAEWEDTVENDEEEEEEADEADEEEDDDDDDASEAADAKLCMHCKGLEGDAPNGESEPLMACKGCGEHAHQQCARDANAFNESDGVAKWKCPECAGDDEASGSNAETIAEEAAPTNGDGELGEISPASSRRLTDSKLARDLLPAENKPDSHSVFNQLVLDEDPMDGSRVLRKRKTSSAEAELEEDVVSLRKRRRHTSEQEQESAQDETASHEKPNGAEETLRPRSSRSLRLKISNPEAMCTVMKKSRNTLVVKMRVDPAELRRILSQKPKSQKRSDRKAASRSARSTTAARAGSAAEALIPPIAPFMSSSYTQPFYSFYDKDTDELKGKPYGGILNEAEADTSKTLPTKDDRRRFDEAKQQADEEWRIRVMKMQAEMDLPIKKSKKTAGPASQIECIEFGGWEIDTWYAAPYPEEYSRNRVLYICEFCLKYMNSDYVAWRHKLKCPAKHPPGDEIYRHGSVSFFEVDGRKNPVYCQNLCLLAKLFLGSKTLYYDVEPFLFYVLCEYDDMGYHFVGYFSKEKRASSQNNVSCILTLPIHQRKGYGNLLIDFSYLLTRVEEKTGSPEKPLSDMGLVSYRNYWRLIMCKYLLEQTPADKSAKTGLSVRKIADDTGMMPDDVISALEGLRCLVRDPQTKVYAFRVDLPFCREYVAKWESKNYVKLKEDALTWTPYVMGRSNATNFELGPALNAIAPREEDEDAKTVQVLAESGIATGDFAVMNGVNPKPSVEVEPSVLESTEPNDNAVMQLEETQVNGNGIESRQSQEEMDIQRGSDSAALAEDADEWMAQYDDIPAVRFEVFPHANPKRPAMPRMNSSAIRPSAPRAPATVPRPRPRRPPSGGSARKSASKPKSTSVRKKSGGTGRGPGRWPKGTKKSDYGNADSGPGLPPGWLEREKQRLAALAGGDNAEDTVQVQVQETKSKRGAKNVEEATVTAAHFEVQDAPVGGSSGAETETVGNGDKDTDVVMGDEDAEGEDE